MSKRNRDLEEKRKLVDSLIEEALKEWAKKLRENRISGAMLTTFDDSNEKGDDFCFLVDLMTNSALLLPTVEKLWAEIEKALNEVPMPDIAKADLISKIREKPQKEPSLAEFESEIRKWVDHYVSLKGNLAAWEEAYAREAEKEVYAGLAEYRTFD